MKLIKGNMFHQKCDALCITTNGFIKKSGEAVCGRGCAFEASKQYDGFKIKLGNKIKYNGNIVQIVLIDKSVLKGFPKYILSFPVKHYWFDKADYSLIDKSCYKLLNLMGFYEWDKVVLPRPGCGNGKLKWVVVKTILEKHFGEDDRLYVIEKEE